MKRYTQKFYDGQRDRSLLSARTVVPLVNEQVKPRSVIDVGCGTGAWLSVFREQGIEEVTGLDGAWVDTERLLVPAARFRATDLQEPIRLDRTFDLVISLEVAEHLPADRAFVFVESLTRLGPAVLFSAAVPGQGGTHHVNEQWQSYWVALFRERGFTVIDSIRKRIWKDESVEWWYAQNTLLFVRNDRMTDYPALLRETSGSAALPLDIVHPKLYLAARDPSNIPPRKVFAVFPALLKNSIISMLRTLLGRG